jgi:hypothetical protein
MYSYSHSKHSTHQAEGRKRSSCLTVIVNENGHLFPMFRVDLNLLWFPKTRVC